jgi:hypothetical protein
MSRARFSLCQVPEKRDTKRARFMSHPPSLALTRYCQLSSPEISGPRQALAARDCKVGLNICVRSKIVSCNRHLAVSNTPPHSRRSPVSRNRLEIADPGLLQSNVAPWQTMKWIAGRQPSAPARYNRPLPETGICLPCITNGVPVDP